MRLTATGWSRNCGVNEIADIDLQSTKYTEGKGTYGVRSPLLSSTHSRIKPDRINGVTLDFFANVRLGGDYGFHLKLSKSEIAHLFYLTHKTELEKFAGLFPGLLPEEEAEEEAA